MFLTLGIKVPFSFIQSQVFDFHYSQNVFYNFYNLIVQFSVEWKFRQNMFILLQ